MNVDHPEYQQFDPDSHVRRLRGHLGFLSLLENLFKNTPLELEPSPSQFLREFETWKEKEQLTDEDISPESFLADIRGFQSDDSIPRHARYLLISLGDQLETFLEKVIDLKEKGPLE